MQLQLLQMSIKIRTAPNVLKPLTQPPAASLRLLPSSCSLSLLSGFPCSLKTLHWGGVRHEREAVLGLLEVEQDQGCLLVCHVPHLIQWHVPRAAPDPVACAVLQMWVQSPAWSTAIPDTRSG